MDNLEIKLSANLENSNFESVRRNIIQKIGSLKLELVSDEDFGEGTENVKALKKIESGLKDAKLQAFSKIPEILNLFDSIDSLVEEVREARLILERQIRKQKQEVKDELINQSILKINDYINKKGDLFLSLKNGEYIQRAQYVEAIKGRATIPSVSRALKELEKKIENKIDEKYLIVNKNMKIVENIPEEVSYLFQDLQYLVELPYNELNLTIQNRIAKNLTSQNDNLIEKINDQLNQEYNDDIKGTNKNHYVITIDLTATRSEAIEIAREIRSVFGEKESIDDIRLSYHS